MRETSATQIWRPSAYVRAYGLGHFGKSLLWNFAGFLFAYYLTEIAGLSAPFAGLLLGCSMLLNATADLALGARLASHVKDCASAARYQRIGATCTSVALVAFVAGTFLPDGPHLPWLIVTLIAFRLSYSLFDVPQNAYLALATDDTAYRARLSSIRYTASGAAILAIGVAFAPIAALASGIEGRGPLLALASVAGVVTIFGAYALPANALDGHSGAGSTHLPTRSRPVAFGYASLLVAIAGVTVASQFFSKFEAHFSALAEPSMFMPWLLTAAAIGQIASQPVWIALGSRGGEREVLGWACFGWAACALIPLLLPIEGAMFLVAAFLYRACWSGVSVGIWMILGRLAAPPSRATLRVGGFTFISKLAEAAAWPLIGVLLERAFYNGAEWDDQQIWMVMVTPAAVAAVLLTLLVLRRLLQQTSEPT